MILTNAWTQRRQGEDPCTHDSEHQIAPLVWEKLPSNNAACDLNNGRET